MEVHAIQVPSHLDYIRKDGTTALTADWNVGSFDLTAVDITATGKITATSAFYAPKLDSNASLLILASQDTIGLYTNNIASNTTVTIQNIESSGIRKANLIVEGDITAGGEFHTGSESFSTDQTGNAFCPSITLGVDEDAGTPNEAGYVKLFSAGDNAYYSTFTAGEQTANATYTLPTAMPAGNDYSLVCSTAGVLSWNNQALTTTSNPTFANITDSGLTATRVVFAGASGLLSDDAAFYYTTASDTLTIDQLKIIGNGSPGLEAIHSDGQIYCDYSPSTDLATAACLYVNPTIETGDKYLLTLAKNDSAVVTIQSDGDIITEKDVTCDTVICDSLTWNSKDLDTVLGWLTYSDLDLDQPLSTTSSPIFDEITANSFIALLAFSIGEATLEESEFTYLDGLDQPLKKADGPTFADLTVTTDIETASITIGANTLDTNEWAYLDGVNQQLRTSDDVTFGAITSTVLIDTRVVFASTDGLLSSDANFTYNSTTDALTVSGMTFDAGSITDATGAISFGNENLSTTGTLAAAHTTIDTTLLIESGKISDSSGAISFDNENISTTGTLAAAHTTIDSTLLLESAKITDSGGSISFDNENLSTTGTLAAAHTTIDTTLLLQSGSITDSSGAITFDNENISTTGTLGAGAITGTSFIIAAHTLDENEWHYLDGQDQAVKTTDAPTFANVTISANGVVNGLAFGKQHTDSAVTGTTDETTLATITIPANTLGANGALRITSLWNFTASTNLKTMKIYFGGTNFAGAQTVTATTDNLYSIVYITNRNNTAVQVGSGITVPSVGSTDFVAGTVDTTASKDITLTGKLADTGETITLKSVLVEVIK